MATPTTRLALSKPASGDAISAFQPAIDTTLDTIDGAIWINRGAYNGATAYVVNDVVTYLGQLWVAIAPTTGSAPPSAAWAPGSTHAAAADLTAETTRATAAEGVNATAIALKAADSAVVHNTGAEAIAGVKTFSSAPVLPAAALPESAVSGLVADLAAKATPANITTAVAAEATIARAAEGVNAAAITAEASTARAAELLRLKLTGAWSSATAYAVNDAVTYLGQLFYCTSAHTNDPPPGTHWAPNGTYAQAADLTTETARATAAEGANATAIAVETAARLAAPTGVAMDQAVFAARLFG